MDFPVKKNVSGPIAELGHQLCLRAEAIIAAPVKELGRTRGLHVIAMVERSGSDPSARKPGTFDASLVGALARALRDSHAHLLPEESRFREITVWHDPEEIRKELRLNLLRLVREEESPCVRYALDMHVLHDSRVRQHVGSHVAHLDSSDFYGYASLRAALGRCIQHVPELVLWSTLRSTVQEIAEPRARVA